MGSWYDQIAVKGPTQHEITAYLSAQGWDAFISPTVGGVTAVYDNEADVDIARELSRHFSCATLFMYVADSDYLFYRLYENGEMADTFMSAPFLHEDNTRYERPKWLFPPPQSGKPEVLCAAFAREDALQDVRDILQQDSGSLDSEAPYRDGDTYHEQLTTALQLYWLGWGMDYDSINAGVDHYLNQGFAVSGTRKPSRLQTVMPPFPTRGTWITGSDE